MDTVTVVQHSIEPLEGAVASQETVQPAHSSLTPTAGYSLYDMNTATVTEQPIEPLEGTDWFDRMMNELSAEAEIFNPWEDLHDLDEILGVANDDSMELILKDFL